MAFHLRTYTAPDFSKEKFISAPDVVLKEAPVDMAAPENFHALSIFPEYFKINGKWLLIYDGYFHESEKASAPSFDIIIDGIESQA